jgi:acetyl-CoA carboxylase biotin carboxyl carrier protein
MSDLTDDDVREILRIVDESGLDELRIETGGLRLHVVRDGAAPAPAAPSPAAAPPAAAPPAAAPAAPPDDGAQPIPAPMLGTFYRAEGPGRAPYVDVGASVEPGTVVALIEVMKMMNSVTAGVAGTIVEVCADNATLVEYGAPLFRVKPAG